VAVWLRNEINVQHRELNKDTVTHLSTNRARRRLTSSIEAKALTTTPDHQPCIEVMIVPPWLTHRHTETVLLADASELNTKYKLLSRVDVFNLNINAFTRNNQSINKTLIKL